MNEKQISLYTLGCKVNQYESEAFAEALEAHGYTAVQGGRNSAVCIINTCTVTAESDRKCRQTIRHAIADNPGAYIIVTGCFAQISPEEIRAIEGVDCIIGNRSKMQVVEMAKTALEGTRVRTTTVPSLSDATYEEMQVKRSERTRAYIKIQDGCENNCSYCIIPKARGPIRSRKVEDVMKEAIALVASGYKEIVLTGIEVAAYGRDLQDADLVTLLTALNGIEGLERIRLSSIELSFLRPHVIEGIAKLQKVCHHFHLSLQSGCSRTLAAMKRKYNADMIKATVKAMREAMPDVLFSADIIVGFPTETSDDFAETYALLSELSLLHMHVFSYSRRPGTPAAELKSVASGEEIKARSKALLQLDEESRQSVYCRMAPMGSRHKVLFEAKENGMWQGHTESFMEIAVTADNDLHSEIREVEIIGFTDKKLLGKLV
ncbi:MAG: tRNA (N(6)-L-threonylcarbamoyladenosine(37)-C(2))-methylthiotransferase MtaB [Ruminococcaceae bacterium]|nr:tRNA (N(6)-L-threonylcarbamoyladenosine(37)-C(2))-methylthiotransferase MtaB [Oscillospiraceae bacterium]